MLAQRIKDAVGDERIVDCFRVVLPSTTTIAFIRAIDLKTIGELVLVALNVAYVAWRWRRDARKTSREEDV